MSDDDDYEVGYKRPPANRRFKKGQSGNPKGRPRKMPAEPVDNSLAAILKRVGEQTIEIAGERRTLDEVAIYALYKKAMTGSAAAHAELARLRKELGLLKPARRGGVLLVPSPVPLDQWEAACHRQQAQFREKRPTEEDET